VRGSGLCAALDEPVRRELSRRASVARLPAGVTLCPAGEEMPYFAILASGYLRSVRYGAGGERQVVGLTLPGEPVVPGRPRLAELETATPVRLCRIERGTYERLIRLNGGLRREVYAQARGELDRLRWIAWTLGALRPEERIAAFLVAATGFMPWQPLAGGGGVLSVELGRADIADLLGTTVETLSRTTRRLHREGLIVIRDPWHFAIPDAARLAPPGSLPEPGTAFPALPGRPAAALRAAAARVA
jgi:CRP/FNR family transcriptional regulator